MPGHSNMEQLSSTVGHLIHTIPNISDIVFHYSSILRPQSCWDRTPNIEKYGVCSTGLPMRQIGLGNANPSSSADSNLLDSLRVTRHLSHTDAEHDTGHYLTLLRSMTLTFISSCYIAWPCSISYLDKEQDPDKYLILLWTKNQTHNSNSKVYDWAGINTSQ